MAVRVNSVQVFMSLTGRRSYSVCILLLLWSLLASNLTAQEEQAPTFRSESNLVVVPALVRNSRGNIVYGLQASDFVIQDDGVPQLVRVDEQAEAEPVSVVVAIQVGRRANFEFPRIRGLNAMLAPLLSEGRSQVAVLFVDSRVHPVGDFTTDPDLLARDLKQVSPGDGGAAMLDAVNQSVQLLNTAPRYRQRVVLLIGETRDHGSQAKAEDVVRSLGDSNVVVYALSFSPAKSNVLDTLRGNNNPDLHPEQTEVHEGPDLLAPILLVTQAMHSNSAKAVAAMSGGEYERFDSAKQFDLRMNDFANHLHNRYVLSFQPKDPHPGLHQLQVQLKEPTGATVLARTSYWAKGNQP
ncbi:MAG TPA: VWA domain-containing protein [Candidatus Eisenbacteria bacterium]|nr:VWA domain-containing protein [Candidatus Eisenbacteria bacterium]